MIRKAVSYRQSLLLPDGCNILFPLAISNNGYLYPARVSRLINDLLQSLRSPNEGPPRYALRSEIFQPGLRYNMATKQLSVSGRRATVQRKYARHSLLRRRWGAVDFDGCAGRRRGIA